ncbi:GtrA family protein [Luteimonas sp. FCS-9]|uniref:GtrA family protein n=1 Tax=Luteimonas sp. FCS-9 TaxID=1547516 RepID=UPI00063E8616|nr:GtrA family protein [Luteimonas sp. FCS-9]KLI98612.1 polysaccharide biosynthesis protein GtrA [Luteimonas sp. FCS-9]
MSVPRNVGLRDQIVRYFINGVIATAIHFCALTFNIEVLAMQSAGIANGLAAVFGIAASFLGSRYFVFRGSSRGVVRQGALFVSIYAGIALLHSLVLYVWTDRLVLDYRVGFLVATSMQIVISFVANKFVVFK